MPIFEGMTLSPFRTLAAAVAAATVAFVAWTGAGAQQPPAEKGKPPAATPGKPEGKAPGTPPPGPKGPDARGSDSAKSGAPGRPSARKLPDTPEQRAKLLDDLYAHLATAEDEAAAKEVVQSIVRIWMHSGSDTVDALMQRALKAVHDKKLDLAKRLLDAVVEQAPEYAEGWSNRGHVHYLDNDIERALGDLRRALALDPNHFKALDGLGTILREVGQKKGALKAYEQLLSVHPFASGAKQAHDDLKREVDGQGI